MGKIIDLIPEDIPFTWRGKYHNGEKWKSKEWLFTEIKTDNRAGKTVARAYRSFTNYYGDIDKHSMMPAYTSTRQSDLFCCESSNPDEAIQKLYDWLVTNNFIRKNGKLTSVVHEQADINAL